MNPKEDEITVLTRAIYYIRAGWGANCKVWDFEPSCGSCQARVAIAFLKKSIKYAKETNT